MLNPLKLSLVAAVSSCTLITASGNSQAQAQQAAPLPELTVEGRRAAPAPQSARSPVRTPRQTTAPRRAPTPTAVPAPTEILVGGRPVENTTAGPVRGYQAITSRAITRTDTPIEHVPQSITVLPRRVLDDQGVTTQSEAFRNVSGVQPLSVHSAGQGSAFVRGFLSERFVDGLPNFYDYGARDIPINVERIEVLKGPGSIFYQGGPNPIGGAINIVSKVPTMTRFATAGITVGSYGMVSPFFDINQPLNAEKTLLFRVTGQHERTGAVIDDLDRRTFALNPTLMFNDRNGTVLTLQGHLSQHRQQDYPGLSTIGTLDRSGYTVRRDLFPTSRDLPKADSRLMSLTAKIEHAFNDVWSVNGAARISKARFREPAQFIFGNLPAFSPSTFGIWNADLNQDQTEFSANANTIAKFDWGMTKNRFLLGLDNNRVKDDGIFNGALVGATDFADPVFPNFVHPPEGAFTTFQKPRNTYEQYGATVQWQSTVWDRLHVLAALKLANVQIDSRDSSLAFPQDWNTSKTKLLPRLGLAYEIMPGITPFVGYSQGLRAVQFYTSALTTTAPKPEESEQIEGGVKLNLAQGLSGTLAAFQIKRHNVPVTVGFVQQQTGEQRSQGFEADLVWQPTPNWSFLGSYAYTETRITKDTNAANLGKDLFDIPRNSGRFWANYTVTEGMAKRLTFGAGLYASSSRRVDLGGPWRTPAYVTFDGRIAYSQANWSIALVGKNLLDRTYYVPYRYLSGRVAPADGRTVQATFTSTF
jgi:iron complex outermembrane receptor protein